MNPDFDELTKTLQRKPKDSKTLQLLGQYYLFNGYYKQAREEYGLSLLFSPRITSAIMLDHEEAIKKNPNDIQARLSLISFCLMASDLDAAILELEELLDIDKTNLQAYNILGRLFIKKEKIDEAILLLEHGLDLGIKDLSISEMLASVYLEKGRLDEAIHFYEEMPTDKKNLRTLAELYQRTGKLEKSAEKYFMMYQEDHEVASEVQQRLEALLMKNIGSVGIREYLADLYSRLLKPDLAVKKIDEVVKIAPEKAGEAINKLKQLLKTYPLNPEATISLADKLAQKGSYSEAIEEYYKLIRSKPDMIDHALEGCKKIIEKYPDQFLARQFLVESFISQEKIENAVFEIKIILKTFPDSADWIITKCKDFSKKYPELKECLGAAYSVKGDFTQAIAEAEGLSSIGKQSISAMLLLGDIYLKQKLTRKAVETLQKALMSSPYNKAVHEKFREAKLNELEIEAEQLKKRISEDEWKVSLHLDLGKNALARGAKDEAQREFQIASKDTQRASYVYSILGNYYRNEGLYDQSLDAFRRALQFASADSIDQQKKSKFGMALTYEAQGQIKYSIKLLEEIEQEDMDFAGLKNKIKFLKNTNLASLQNRALVVYLKDLDTLEIVGMWGREPKKSTGRQNLSVSFGQNYNNSGLEFFIKGMHTAAEEEFNLSAQLDPHYSAGLNNLGVAQLINKKTSFAVNNLKEAYENDPAFAVVINNLGIALFASGLNSEAEYKLQKAIELDPELSAAKINLADIYYANGKVKEALDLYKQIQSSDILFDLAQARLLYKTV